MPASRPPPSRPLPAGRARPLGRAGKRNGSVYSFQYDPVGRLLEEQGFDGNATEGAAGMRNPIRFQGQYEDIEMGLCYNRYRYYDSDTARYLTQDPVGLVGGGNSYAYARNPTGWIDQLGLTPNCGGTATVHWHHNRGPGNAYGHYSIETNMGGKTMHTHQLGALGTPTMIINERPSDETCSL